MIRSISRPYMFTASTSPGVAAAATAAFDRIEAMPELRDRLWANVNALYDGVSELGFEVGPEPSPVVAIKCPDKGVAVAFWNALIDAGLYTNIAIPQQRQRVRRRRRDGDVGVNASLHQRSSLRFRRGCARASTADRLPARTEDRAGTGAHPRRSEETPPCSRRTCTRPSV